eukprot:g76855.t1
MDQNGSNAGPVRPLITDVETISLSSKVAKYLDCPVCFSIINKCTTTMECIHRFCEECIETTLRQGQKKCPVCNNVCPSRRNLRGDAAFDKIIKTIITDRSAEEEQREVLLQQKIKSRDHKAWAETHEKAHAHQEQLAKKRRATVHTRPQPKKSPAKPDKIMFSLKLHPSCPTKYTLPRPYLRTSREITVGLLYRYLAKKFNLDDPSVITLSIWCNERLLVLQEGNQTLDNIESTLWAFPSGLTLFYNIRLEG